MPSETAVDSFQYAFQTELLKLYFALGLGLAMSNAYPFGVIDTPAIRNVLTWLLNAGGLLVAVGAVVGTLHFVLVDAGSGPTDR